MTGRRVAIGLIALVLADALVCVGGGALIDGSVDVGVERAVAAPLAAVVDAMDDEEGLRRWWSHAPRPDGLPPLQIAHASGPAAGPGAVYVFTGNGNELERWTVVEQTPDRFVWDVEFSGLMTVRRTVTIAADGDHARVGWRETGRIGNPVLRWSKVLMPADQVEANFILALGALEKAAAAK